MAFSVSQLKNTLVSWAFRVLRWMWVGLSFLGRFLLALWATLAIYYSNLPWPWMRVVLAVAFAAFGIWSLYVTRKPRMRWAFAGVFLVVLVWFISIQPSHHRPWRREVTLMPRAIIDGDHVRLTGVRNFEYRSRNDFTEHYLSLIHISEPTRPY